MFIVNSDYVLVAYAKYLLLFLSQVSRLSFVVFVSSPPNKHEYKPSMKNKRMTVTATSDSSINSDSTTSDSSTAQQ